MKNFLLRLWIFFFCRKNFSKQLKEKKINGILEHYNSFILILPETEQEMKGAVEIIYYLLSLNKNVLLIVNNTMVHNILSIKNCKYEEYVATEKNRFNLPKHSLLNRLKNKNAEIVIDLNNRFNYFSRIIAYSINADVRIGFKSEIQKLEYDIEFENLEQKEEIIYKNFLNFIKMFV